MIEQWIVTPEQAENYLKKAKKNALNGDQLACKKFGNSIIISSIYEKITNKGNLEKRILVLSFLKSKIILTSPRLDDFIGRNMIPAITYGNGFYDFEIFEMYTNSCI